MPFSKDLVGLFALVVATLAFFVAYRKAIADTQPVLVFQYDEAGAWSVTNVGNGPALDIVVLEGDSRTNLKYPVRIPALQKGVSFPIKWLADPNISVLGARYKDLQGTSCVSICEHDRSVFHRLSWRRPVSWRRPLSSWSCPNDLPEFAEKPIKRHWNATSSDKR